MLRRKVLPQIEEWYQGGCRKALLLTGARQVGKTTAVREFAKSHYKHEVPTILGSDAHISFQIADYERLYPLLAETDFPDDLIMNYWPDKFFDYLGIQR